jgi:hypothetical protein
MANGVNCLAGTPAFNSNWGKRMRSLLLTGASLLALMVAAPTASATIFNFTGAVAEFTAPSTGAYGIVAFGAQVETA